MSEPIFDAFKQVLLFKYPKVSWTKYLQRDCAQVNLEDGKTITLHLWEEVQTIWMSGEGKKDWYNKEFQDIYFDAASGRVPGKDILMLILLLSSRDIFILTLLQRGSQVRIS